MDGTSYFPSRAEMERNLVTFAERSRNRGPLRLPLGGDQARVDRRRRPLRPRDIRRRVPLPRGRLRGRRRRAVRAAHSGPRPASRTTPTRDRPRRTPASGSSSSASRTPGSSLPAGCCPGPGPSSWPRRVRRSSRSSPARSSGSGRATSSRTRTTSWPAGSPSWRRRSRVSSGPAKASLAGDRQAVRPAATRSPSRSTRPSRRPGFVAPLRDLPALGRRNLRIQPPARPDAILGERHRPRDLLRRHDQPGRGRSQEARPAGQLRGGARGPLQRPPARRAHRREALRRGPGATAAGRKPRCCRSCSTRSAGPRAVAPAGLPRPSRDLRPRIAGSRTRGSCRWPTSWTPAGRTRSRPRSRPTPRAPSIR